MAQQFSMRSVFGLTAIIALLFAMSAWINSPTDLKIAPLFAPSIPMMGVGMILSLFLWITSVIIIASLVIRKAPRPLSLTLFAGLQIVGMLADVSYWHIGTKLILAMLLACIIMCAEVYFRKLPSAYLSTCVPLSLAIVGAWYVAAICVAASAAV